MHLFTNPTRGRLPFHADPHASHTANIANLQAPILARRESLSSQKSGSTRQWLKRAHGWVEVPSFFAPRWLLCALLAALVTLLICGPVWPGFMSFDSMFAYKQSISGVETAVWPPMHDYFFFISRVLGLGVGGVFVFQTFALFFSAGLILSMVIGRPWRFLAGFAAFVISFYYFPTMLGTTIVLWKDVLVASVGLLGVALWMIAVRSSSWLALLAAVLSVSVAISLRHNGLPLFFPFLILLIFHPLGSAPSKRSRVIATVAVMIGLLGAVATDMWRLPDFQRLPSAVNAFSIVEMWDLIGVSACENKNLLPPAFSVDGELSGRELRILYDPRHLNLTLEPPPGVKRLTLPVGDTSAEISAAWKGALRHHLPCYLSHRAAVFREQMGLSRRGIFYPTHGGIDPNSYGLRLAYPLAAASTTRYIGVTADLWWHRPVILYLLAGLVVILAFLASLRTRGLLLMLSLGTAGYLASNFCLMPAADARYIFPSSVFCALAIGIGFAGWRSKSELSSAKDQDARPADEAGAPGINAQPDSTARVSDRSWLRNAFGSPVSSTRIVLLIVGVIVAISLLFIIWRTLNRSDTSTKANQKIAITQDPMPPYPGWAGAFLGKPVHEFFPKLGNCVGNTDLVIQKFAGNPPGSQIIGWGWDSASARPLQRVVLVDASQRIVGAGEGGSERPDVPARRPEITTSKVGWQALVGLSSGTVEVYGVTSEPQTLCRLGSIAW
jgi:hypothetical protein